MKTFFSTKLTVCCLVSYFHISPALFRRPYYRSFLQMASFSSNSQENTSRSQSATHKASIPITIGLTGSIGMGKSTIAKQFIRLGVPVFDADLAVHELYSKGGEAVEPLTSLFPDITTQDGAIDRAKLSKVVLSDPSSLKLIESIVHPLVSQKRDVFLENARSAQQLMVVYDIPLLFENRHLYTLDYVVVVSASAETQKKRVLERPNMTEEKLAVILSKQVADEQKRALADYVIMTDYDGYVEGRAQLARVIEDILAKEHSRFEQWKRRPSSGEDRVSSPSRPWDAVIFDLDDTLAANVGPLKDAYQFLERYMQQYMPNTYRVVHGQVASLMKKCKEENPLIGHDLTELRATVLRTAAKPFNEDQYVSDLMKGFLEVRSNLSSHLYPDTLPCLAYLTSQGIRYSVLTNGNAKNTSLHANAQHFLSARDMGASKPSPVGFIACCLLKGLPPHRVLYVGDSYEKDIVGAKAVGMKTALLLRDEGDTKVSREELTADEAGVKAKYPDADMIWTSLDPAYIEEMTNRFAEGLIKL